MIVAFVLMQAAGPAQAQGMANGPFGAIGGSGGPETPGAMVPVAPFRALDTRTTAAVAPDASVSFQVAGVGGIPAGVSAAVFNLTVTAPESYGLITAYASGAPRPFTSNVNFSSGQTLANLVTVPVGTDGKVTLFNRSPGTTQIIADVSGYYLAGTPSVPGAFSPIAPTRMLDTRTTAAVAPDAPVSFQVGGAGGIPAGVSAVVFNLTITAPQSYGLITAYASGTPRPTTSNVNFSSGQTLANLVTVPVGTDGKVTLFNRSPGTTQIIADVSGYYLAGTPSVPGAFSPIAPTRMLDTRTTAAVDPDASVSFQVGGVGGIPAGVSAVVFNLTITAPQQYGLITAYASGAPRPATSNVNFSRGQTLANLVTVPVGTDGKVTLFNRSPGTTQLIADVSGYYLPGAAVGSVWIRGEYYDQPGAVPYQVSGLSGVTALTGNSTKYAVLTDKTVRSWGANSVGQIGNGTVDEWTRTTLPVPVSGLTSVRSVDASYASAFALLEDGTVWAWGANYYGILGNGTDANSSTPVQVTGLNGVESVITSNWAAYALLADGTVWAWGYNFYGQLGNGTTTNSSIPIQVAGLTGVKSLETTQSGVYAVLVDGTVRAWGNNGVGQLGNGSRTNSSIPVQVTGLTDVESVVSAGSTAFAILADGTVRAWGSNSNGQLGDGTTTGSNVPVQVTGLTGVESMAVGIRTAYALLSDGSLRAWGSNSNGQLGNGTTTDSNVPVQVGALTGVKTITSSGTAAQALLTDGTIWKWGSNNGELLSTPTQVTGFSTITSLQQ
jgi:alpha-tubulin suppressor-like RCC1 family protein